MSRLFQTFCSYIEVDNRDIPKGILSHAKAFIICVSRVVVVIIHLSINLLVYTEKKITRP